MKTLISQLYASGGDSGQGYATEGDVLVNQTADGVDLNAIWAQAASAMSLYNRERSALAALISYPTTNVATPSRSRSPPTTSRKPPSLESQLASAPSPMRSY